MERSPRAEAPRMVDIARQAGVSRMAVSAVLMGTGVGRVRVSQATADRIRAIAQQLGYRPNPSARNLAGRQSGVLAIVATDWGNFLTQRALARMHEVAGPIGKRVLAVHGEKSEAVAQLVSDLRYGWIDGLVYLAYQNEAQWSDVAALFRGQRRAVIAIGDPGEPDVSVIASDVKSGAHQTMQALRSWGRQRPVLVTEERRSRAMQNRIAAYQDAARQFGLHFDESRIIVETENWLISDPSFNPRFDELARHILDRHGSDAILCDTDFTAVGLLRALRRLGQDVPDDISVIGWGDLQFAALYDPPITTVSYDLSTLMNQVVSLIVETEPIADSEGESVPGEECRTTLLPMKLVQRESA